MTTAEIDRRLYSELLAKTLPAVIRSEEQNERYARQLEAMAERWEELSREEQELAKLLTLLIEDFEERNYRLAPAKPAEILQHLMEARGLKQRDLADVFGSRSIVSEVLSGKRGLTVNHIQRLSQLFKISPAVFLECPPSPPVNVSAPIPLDKFPSAAVGSIGRSAPPLRSRPGVAQAAKRAATKSRTRSRRTSRT